VSHRAPPQRGCRIASTRGLRAPPLHDSPGTRAVLSSSVSGHGRNYSRRAVRGAARLSDQPPYLLSAHPSKSGTEKRLPGRFQSLGAGPSRHLGAQLGIASLKALRAHSEPLPMHAAGASRRPLLPRTGTTTEGHTNPRRFIEPGRRTEHGPRFDIRVSANFSGSSSNRPSSQEPGDVDAVRSRHRRQAPSPACL
jgi:hypothetical protein